MLATLFAGSELFRGVLFVQELADCFPVDEVGVLLFDEGEEEGPFGWGPGGVGH